MSSLYLNYELIRSGLDYSIKVLGMTLSEPSEFISYIKYDNLDWFLERKRGWAVVVDGVGQSGALHKFIKGVYPLEDLAREAGRCMVIGSQSEQVTFKNPVIVEVIDFEAY